MWRSEWNLRENFTPNEEELPPQEPENKVDNEELKLVLTHRQQKK